MQETAQFVLVEDVVKQYIDQARLTMAEFRRLYSLAFRGLELLGMDIFFRPKTVKLKVNPNMTVDLPEDYIKYTKIGVLNAKGEVATLERNTNLTSYRINEADRASVNVDRASDTSRISDLVYLNFYYEGTGIVNLYGVGSTLQQLGHFDIDEDQGLIYLDNEFTYDYIILEYISSPQEDATFKIPIQVRECLIAYLAWKDIEYMPTSRKVNPTEKRMRRQEYYNERRLAKDRMMPFIKWEANSIIRMNEKSAVKA